MIIAVVMTCHVAETEGTTEGQEERSLEETRAEMIDANRKLNLIQVMSPNQQILWNNVLNLSITLTYITYNL